MPGAESTIVLLPRFTTFLGIADSSLAQPTTLPLDVSRYGSAQFQVWRGPLHDTGEDPPAAFNLYMEESLDAENWTLGASQPQSIVIVEGIQFFSYAFRLRWFRLRVSLTGVEPMVTCWAEGLLR